MISLKIVFMGTSSFALTVLDTMQQSGLTPAAVVTKPDTSRNRGKKTLPPPVKERALELGLPVLQPRKWDSAAIARLKELKPDLVVTAAYGLLLPAGVLATPVWGCINIHPSLLPRYRGPAPLQRAIMNGDQETGVSLYLMDAGMDTGPLLAQQPTALDPEEDTGNLSRRLAVMGSDMLVKIIPQWVGGEITPQPQQGEPTYAPPLSREEEVLHWEAPAEVLGNHIRGLSPSPGAYTFWRGKRLKIWQAKAVTGSGKPGQVISALPLEVAAGKGVLRLLKVQPEGKRPMPAEDFVRGYRLQPGETLGGV